MQCRTKSILLHTTTAAGKPKRYLQSMNASKCLQLELQQDTQLTTQLRRFLSCAIFIRECRSQKTSQQCKKADMGNSCPMTEEGAQGGAGGERGGGLRGVGRDMV